VTDRLPAEPSAETAEAVASALGTDVRAGLTATEAAGRLATTGPNELEAVEPTSLARLVFGAVTEMLRSHDWLAFSVAGEP
jgi:hypothetical protein